MRRYLESHPWITFRATGVNDLNPRTWMLLGEARSKCEHLAGVPLQPAVAQRLFQAALVRGAQASTAIEGNSLTDEQVQGILDGTYSAPPSQSYQEQEVRNLLEALQNVSEQAWAGDAPVITAELICEYNRQVLDGTDHPEDVIPGAVRGHSVVVGRYRGAPSEDCMFLLGRLADWLESDTFRSDDADLQFARYVAAAVCAHLYVNWIHPFGDGNGRTARLLEFAILARSGVVPFPAALLLSNHYNLTRDRYYRELRAADESGSITDFVAYAIEGLVDGLRDQVAQVREQVLRVTWTNFVHEVMGVSPATKGRDRRQALVLAMSPSEAYTRQEIAALAQSASMLYAQVGPKTLSRDLNRLVELELIVKQPDGWRAKIETLAAFLPPIAPDDEG